jgi:hypothetical protein
MSQPPKPPKPTKWVVRLYSKKTGHVFLAIMAFVSVAVSAWVVNGTLLQAETAPTSALEQRWYQRINDQIAAVWSVITQTSQQIVAGVPLQIAQVSNSLPPILGGGGGGDALPVVGVSVRSLQPAVQGGTLRINTPLEVDNALVVTGTTTITGPLVASSTLDVLDIARMTTLEVSDLATLNSLTVLSNTTLATLLTTGLGTFGSISTDGTVDAGTITVSGEGLFAELSVSGEARANSLRVASQTEIQGLLTVIGGINTNGADVVLGEGSLFASNVVNEIIAGANVVISGTRNQPVISVNTDNLIGVLRLNGQSGNLNLVGGADISVSGLTIFNTATLSSVRSRGGCSGCITDEDVSSVLTITGGSIDGTPIGLTTPATAQFSEVSIGTTTDAITLAVGGGVSISDVLVVGGVATSTFSGSINILDGCFAVNGNCVESLTPTYLGLTDTPSSYIAGALQFANDTATELTQSETLVFDGTNLGIGTSSPSAVLTVGGNTLLDGTLTVTSSSTFFGDTTIIGDSLFTGAFSVINTIASEFSGGINVTNGCVSVDGVCIGAIDSFAGLVDVDVADATIGDLIQYDGTTWRNITIADLGLGNGTYLGLTDTPSSYIAGALQFANDTATELTQSETLVFLGGNLGLGTTSPSARLTVNGDMYLTGAFRDASNTTGLEGDFLVSTGTSTRWISATSLGDNTFLGLNDTPASYIAGALQFANDTATELTQDNTLVFLGGNLGVGTTSPSARLTIAGDLLLTGAFRDTANEVGNPGDFLVSTGTSTRWITYTALGDNTFLGLNDTPASYIAGALQFANDTATELTQSETLVFDGTNLGIGTSSPSAVLTVGGNTLLDGTLTVTSSSTFFGDTTIIGDSLFTGAFSVINTIASEFSGGINVTNGCVSVDGVCIGAIDSFAGLVDVDVADATIGDLIQYDGTTWRNITIADLGLGNGTYLGLTDTPSSYIAGALQFANGTATGVTQSSTFVFNNNNLGIGTSTPASRLSVVGGDISVYGGGASRWYNTANSQYVGFRAPTSLSTSTVWSLPPTDGLANQLLVTDGAGNLSFSDISALGGGAVTYLELLDTPSTFASSSIPFANTAGTALTQSDTFVFRDGNLGVGIASPSSRLTVEGTVRFQLSTSTSQLGLTYGAVGNRFGFGTENPNEFVTIRGSVAQRGGGVGERYQPRVASGLNLSFGDMNDIAVVGTYAYVVSGATTNNFHVIDITDPDTPVLVATRSLPIGLLSIEIIGQYAYVGGTFFGDGFYIVDISEPTNPTLVRTISVVTDVRDILINGRYAYLAIGSSIVVYDIGDLLNPVAVASISVTDNIETLALSGSFLYAGSGPLGNQFHVFNVSNPLAISNVANLALGGQVVNDIAVQGRYAYLATASASSTLRVIDITIPSAPTQVGALGFGTTANSVVAAGRFVYVGVASGETFRVVDAKTPSSPLDVGGADLIAGSLREMVVRGRYAYVVSSNINQRFQIVDVSGVEMQSAVAHSLQSGSLAVQGNTDIGGRIVAGLGLSAGREGLKTEGVLTVLGTGASQIGGSLSLGTTTTSHRLTVAGDMRLTGALADRLNATGTLGMVLRSSGAGVEWVATSTLGFSTQTLSVGEVGQVPFVQTAGSDFGYSSNFTFAGGTLGVVSTNTLGGVVARFEHTGATAGSASVVDIRQTGASEGRALLRFVNTTDAWSIGIDGARSDAFVIARGEGVDLATALLALTPAGALGIGTTTPSAELTVVGTMQSTTLLGGSTTLETDAQGNIIRAPSDERLKHHISDIARPLDTLLQLRGVRYEWIDTERFGSEAEIGFVAQEVAEVVPEVVRTGGEYWSLRTANLVALVVEAVKELWQRVRGTEEEVERLRERVERLESRLEQGSTTLHSPTPSSAPHSTPSESESAAPTSPDAPETETQPTPETSPLDTDSEDKPSHTVAPPVEDTE